MGNIENSVLKEDIGIIAYSIDFEKLCNKTVLVTGATGLLGSLAVKSLLTVEAQKHIGLKVIAWARSPEKANAVFAQYAKTGALAFAFGDITETPALAKKIDYIIHTASATSSKYFVSNPVETIGTALKGTENVLEIAKSRQAESVLYLSSLEVYGTPGGKADTVSEDDYGYIDPLSPRSSYSEGKRMAECLCASYAAEYGVNVKIARLAQTFGAGVEYNDGRVFAEFARCAIEKKDIVLHTPGNTVRSYCYTADAISALFTILFKGEKGRAYNVANRATACSIKEMAQLVADTFKDSEIGVKIEIPENIASFGYNPEMVIKIDPTCLEQLGWQPKFSLKDMYERTVRSMTEC
ncbi:MAG: NAD-dependent epimerase/dehydratase family protein [Clostridiales bacterium]|nr:NAD-dependent epimerase/dehydratase family protein [Clostridiales bacterium]